MDIVMPFGKTVYRLRAGEIVDPYSGEMVAGDWSNQTVLPVPGSFVAHTSTSMLSSETRSQALEAKSLYCDGDFDVQKGDRIRDGEDGSPLYTIDGIPPAPDVNPFTGFVAPVEIPLERYVG